MEGNGDKNGGETKKMCKFVKEGCLRMMRALKEDERSHGRRRRERECSFWEMEGKPNEDMCG